MFTLTFDEKAEVKKSDFDFTDREDMLWDYATKEEKMHVFRVRGCGFLVFFGDANSFEYSEFFMSEDYLIEYLNCLFREKIEEYEKQFEKEYTIEYVAYALQTIRAKSDKEAREIACENLKKMNKDSEHTKADEYRKSFDWDCCDIHYMVDGEDKYVIYN